MRFLQTTFLLVLLGCGQVESSKDVLTANFQFSNAGGMGTQNGGFYNEGSVFVWNVRTNELDNITTLELPLVSSNRVNARGDQSSSSVAGISISGIPTTLTGSEGIIRTSIGARSEFSVGTAYRENYNRTIDRLVGYVGSLIESGQEPDLILHPRDQDYRVVVINTVLRSKSSNLSVGGADATDKNTVVDVALKTPVGDIFSVKVRMGTTTTCGLPDGAVEDELPVCFFGVIVLNPTYVEGNPRMQFEVGGSGPYKDNLPDAFRNLR